MAAGLFAALLVSFVWICLHIGFMHIRPAESRIRSITAGFLVSLPFVYAAYRWSPRPQSISDWSIGQSPTMALIISYVFHTLVYFLYVECFYHVERAVSLRLLIEIKQRADATARLDEITKNYNVRDMIERRLEALQIHNFITRKGDVCRLEPKGLIFARTMQFSSWIFQSKGQSERD